MKRLIFSLLMMCLLATSTLGALTHFCPGCLPNSDAACTMHESITEKDSCCEAATREQEEPICELCTQADEVTSDEKVSTPTPKSKTQLERLVLQASHTIQLITRTSKHQTDISLRGSPSTTGLVLLKSVRMLC